LGLPKEYRLAMAELFSKGNVHNFIWFSSFTLVHVCAMEVASLSLLWLAIFIRSLKFKSFNENDEDGSSI
jgi:hypothetical protein